MSFGEEPLTTPVVVARTSDKCHPTRLDIRGEEHLIRIEFTKGEGEGENYAAHANDNVTIKNEVDAETGEPAAQDWTDFLTGTQMADWAAAQGTPPSNGKLLAKVATYLLTEKGVI